MKNKSNLKIKGLNSMNLNDFKELQSKFKSELEIINKQINNWELKDQDKSIPFYYTIEDMGRKKRKLERDLREVNKTLKNWFH